jgi:hypothetical protein
MIKFPGTATILLLVGLGGCSTMSCGNSHPYSDSIADQPLHAPPGLNVPAPDPNYSIQNVGSTESKDVSKDAAGSCLTTPPQLIHAQPAGVAKSPKLSKSGPAMPSPINNPPAVKTEESKPTVPASSTTAPPLAVATAGGMG